LRDSCRPRVGTCSGIDAVLTTPLNLAAAPQGLVTVPLVTTVRSQSQAEQ